MSRPRAEDGEPHHGAVAQRRLRGRCRAYPAGSQWCQCPFRSGRAWYVDAKLLDVLPTIGKENAEVSFSTLEQPTSRVKVRVGIDRLAKERHYVVFGMSLLQAVRQRPTVSRPILRTLSEYRHHDHRRENRQVCHAFTTERVFAG